MNIELIIVNFATEICNKLIELLEARIEARIRDYLIEFAKKIISRIRVWLKSHNFLKFILYAVFVSLTSLLVIRVYSFSCSNTEASINILKTLLQYALTLQINKAFKAVELRAKLPRELYKKNTLYNKSSHSGS